MEHFPTVNRLHTDVLEDAYGPIHPEIVRHDDKVREAYLVDEKGVARTYALTFFPEAQATEDIAAIDREIREGGSIGKTFKQHGYEIRKNVVSVFLIELPDWLKEKFATDEKAAKARYSEFYAKKEGGDPVVYATVLEVYTPDFRAAEINDADLSQVNPPTKALEAAGITKQDVWDRITSGNDWSALSGEYSAAAHAGERERESLEMMAIGYIAGRE